MIIGQQLAFEKAGTLHHDVSLGNVSIVDGGSDPEAGFVDFLHDTDYSSVSDVPPTHEDDDLPTHDDPEDSPLDDRRQERTVRILSSSVWLSSADIRRRGCFTSLRWKSWRRESFIVCSTTWSHSIGSCFGSFCATSSTTSRTQMPKTSLFLGTTT